MFLSEAKGLTHWFLLYDETNVYAWDIVRNVYQLLFPAQGIIAIAVDPIKGYIFLATNFYVTTVGFTVSLGDDKMSPSIIVASLPTIVF